jgi:galactan 5-O-arabinofuranosyltransferase
MAMHARPTLAAPVSRPKPPRRADASARPWLRVRAPRWSGFRRALPRVRSWPRAGIFLIEAMVSIVLALGFMLWSITINVDPMSRRGQVSGLAQLQFRLAVCVLVLVVALVVVQRLSAGRHRGAITAIGCAAAAGLATGLVGGGVAVALRGTPYGLWAGDGDYAWILFWVNQMAAHNPVPDYYPPLFLDILRDWSSWSGKPAIYAVKDLQLVGTALFGPAAYLCWRLVLRPAWALGLGVVAAFPFIEPVKPYQQVTLVLLIPILVALMRLVRRADREPAARLMWAGVGYGAGLGLLFLLYSGWFVWGAPGVVAAFAFLAPWRRGTPRALVLAGTALIAFVAVAWPHLRGLLAPQGGLSDNYFYFDTDTDPAYFAMWFNDRQGDILPTLWPPPAEWAGVGLFTIALAVGLAGALWLGWRRVPVVTVGLFAVSAWFLRMYLAGQTYATGVVRLYPRTTMVLLYCMLILGGFAVMYGVATLRARARRTSAAHPGTRFRPTALPVGLALIPLMFLFASAGSRWVDRYLPGKGDSFGGFATEAQNTPQLDGHCPRYATQCTPAQR